MLARLIANITVGALTNINFMHIFQESTGSQEAVLKVQLNTEDYQDRVIKELKDMQKKAQMPGFRPGKVPFGMIQKMYGKSVLVEEVNKLLADAVFKHIKENKLNILGHPVADHEEAEKLDWDKLNDFTFTYYIGLAPDFELDLSSGIEVDYHTILVGDDMVDSYLGDIRKRYGKMTNPGISEKDDVLFGAFEELDTPEQLKAEGKIHKSSLYIQYIKDEDLKGRLIGVKPGEQFVIDLMSAVGSESEAASMVGVKKDELSNYSPIFRFTIESISRVEPAEMDASLYDKVAPGKGIQTEEAFRVLIREQIGMQYQQDVDKHFKNEVRKKLIEMTALPLPEGFLKRWLLDANKETFTVEEVDKEFDKLADTFRWQLIENHLIKEHSLQVISQDIHDHLEGYFREQLKQYGQEDAEQSMIEGFIRNITAKEEEVKKIEEHLYEQKLLQLFKDQLILNRTELSFDDFVKMVTEAYKSQQDDEPASEASTQ